MATVLLTIGLAAAECGLWADELGSDRPPSATAQRTGRAAAQDHWAFQPVRRTAHPRVTERDWPRSAVDRFVLAQLETRGIQPSPEAPRATLVRRLYLDLIGLPPPWQRVQRFVEDPRVDAYERLVEELLASPHYGERWGRHWLDLARYADSAGYESDTPREIWAYRDWVIAALNADMPFDQFVVEQLAGDLLPGATVDQRIATGFHCNAMLDPGVRHESILDRVNTTGAVFLGLTTGCAQCHSHKTDPLTQREFYQLYAFFNEATITKMNRDGSDPAPDEAPTADAEPRDRGPAPPTTLVMKDTPQATHIFVRGDPANPGARVEADYPAFLNVRRPPPLALGVDNPGPARANRLDLARWLVARDHPLTARVTANRIWQRFFGSGLVETENDFGVQTPRPIHAELLDHLALELQGAETATWQGIKSLHRLIVLSATYRQSSDARADLAEADPANRLFARQRRMRLEAEVVRDVSLAASGLLCNRIGGPSVFPYQPDEILDNRATPANWVISQGANRYRRGMYTWVWRLTPHPHLPLFDAPDGVTACTRRDRSNVPLQALTLLNDPTYVEPARALAARIVGSQVESDEERITLLVRSCLSREPLPQELELLRRLVSDQRRSLMAAPGEAAQVAGRPAGNGELSELAVWVVGSRVLMNLDEFLTRE